MRCPNCGGYSFDRDGRCLFCGHSTSSTPIPPRWQVGGEQPPSASSDNNDSRFGHGNRPSECPVCRNRELIETVEGHWRCGRCFCQFELSKISEIVPKVERSSIHERLQKTIKIFETSQCSWCRKFYTSEPFLCPFRRLQSNCLYFDRLSDKDRKNLLEGEKWWWRMEDMIRQVTSKGKMAKCRNPECGALNPNPQKDECWRCHESLCCPIHLQLILSYHIEGDFWRCPDTSCRKFREIPSIFPIAPTETQDSSRVPKTEPVPTSVPLTTPMPNEPTPEPEPVETHTLEITPTTLEPIAPPVEEVTPTPTPTPTPTTAPPPPIPPRRPSRTKVLARCFLALAALGIAAVLAILLWPTAPTTIPNPSGLTVGTPVAGVDKAVVFPDPNLEAAIRQAIGKPKGVIYQSDLNGLTELTNTYTGTRGITNLAGIEHCINLTYLVLEGNHISDISPLAGLTSLGTLTLRNNPVSDISPLSGLVHLTFLDLHACNQIRDISPISNLTSLRNLLVAENQISDVSPLSNLTNLFELSLGGNPIRDISPLYKLTGLRSLSLYSTQVSDISCLSNFTNLLVLGLDGSPIHDISSLSGLTRLIALYLNRTQVSDISALSNLLNLEHLQLFENQISDISSLSNLNKLNFIGLGTNQISDIGALVANTGLEQGDQVHLEGNPLNAASLDGYILQLQNRGVKVWYETPPTST